ncbi:unnamed protein product [Nippostrongylus brasiliensis]|nr:unnamed protein product [Nippostrongylus brasiliensis]
MGQFYERRYGDKPVDVGITIHVSSISAVSEVDMVGVDYLDRLWKPDTFFPNEKKSFFHLATTHNSFLRIDSDGTVYTSQR